MPGLGTPIEGKIVADGTTVEYHQPTMDGVGCEVQHSVHSGKPMCPDLGLCGVGVVLMPTGQPRIVLQLKHADGSSLTATWLNSHAETMVEIIGDAIKQAQQVADEAKAALERAS